VPPNDAVQAMCALASLSPAQREVFVDIVVLEHSQTEIAARLKVSRQNVRNLLRAAKRNLAAEAERLAA
jgi:DNA-directed RNA polymerase specialized sigma24 family protein